MASGAENREIHCTDNKPCHSMSLLFAPKRGETVGVYTEEESESHIKKVFARQMHKNCFRAVRTY